MEALDMVEVFHQYWGGEEPNTHIRGSTSIDGCMHTKDLEAKAVLLKSFNNSCGNRQTGMVDFKTQSVLEKTNFKLVRPPPCRLSTKHKKSAARYCRIFEDQMEEHKM